MSDQPISTPSKLGQFGYLLVAIGIGFVFGCLFMIWTSDRAHGNSKDQADRALSETTRKAPPNPSGQRVLDLGDGLTLKETVRRNDDGKLRDRFTNITQNDKPVMILHWYQTDENNSGHALTKAYWQNGKMRFGESDLDGDGLFEKLYLHDDDGGIKQIFHQTAEGTLLVASKEYLERTQKAYQLMDETMTPFIKKVKEGVSEEEGRELIQDTVKKAKEDADRLEKEFPK